ncbi:MAG TPA: hypothetical protein ENI62_09935 [Gammaproteobacteria bacterium]|nr:hypothetical protein [Gammaproteobacteria bacterium]
MYVIRQWSTRHAGMLETLYLGLSPALFKLLVLLSQVTGERLDGVITWLEKILKGLLFDCRMCGECVLSSTGMTCPMNCPKQIRNGPCGGVRVDGCCEVKPQMPCVWVAAWEGSQRMRHGQRIEELRFAVDRGRTGTSSWLALARTDPLERKL